MEQLKFDCRLESERKLEENVNIALEFACKQVKEISKSKVSNRHDGYGIASEFYAGMKLDQKKVDESMKDFLRILPTEDDAKAVEAASSLKNAATGLVLQATKLAAQADRIMHDLYDISIHVPSWGTTANFHKYSLFFYAINIIFLLFIIPSLFSLVLFMLLF